MVRKASSDSSYASLGVEAGSSLTVEDPAKLLIAQQQLRGARGVAKVALIACGISIPFCVGIVFLLDSGLGLALLGFAALVGVYEALVLVLLARGRYRPWLDWLGSAIEVSVPTGIALIDAARIGPAYALTSAPVMFYGLAVLLSALRLRPSLVLFAGGLGAAQMLTFYAVMQDRLDPVLVERLPSLGVSNVVQRAAYVLLAGIVGWFLCRSLLRLALDLSAQWVARQKSEKQRHALEEQLHQSQKMEAIGQLAGGVAHDFNNQLTLILGHCAFLEEEVEDSALLDDITQIRRAGERAAALTSQLLAFSRKQTLQVQKVDLNALVVDASQMLERLVGPGVVLHCPANSEALAVQVDPNRLEQVLVTLVINARDAMPDGGDLTIEIGRAPEDLMTGDAPEAGWLFLDVTDTGVGMSPDVQTRIFEPFFTTKARGKGTGLGLATAYGIVKQFGGQLSVRSGPGEGSTFRLLLPASSAAPEVAETLSLVSPSQERETVLVAEDEKDLLAFVVRVLRRGGYGVLGAQSAEGALDLARRHKEKIHLLLTDVVMPGPTGKDLWETLRPQRPGMRILYMSGFTKNILGEHAALGPDTPMLPKPFKAEELLSKIREVLDANSAR